MVTRLVHFLKKLESSDPVRIELTDQLLEKYGTLGSAAPAHALSLEAYVLPAAGYMLLELSPQRKASFNWKSFQFPPSADGGWLLSWYEPKCQKQFGKP